MKRFTHTTHATGGHRHTQPEVAMQLEAIRINAAIR